MRSLSFLLLLGVAAPIVPFAATGCTGGTAVFDAIDPKQCATGNGCPMVACACNDGSFMIDSTCEVGKCQPSDQICTDRCLPFMGLKTFVATQNDDVAIPQCDALGERMLVNKCGEGTELIASNCESMNVQCSSAASSFWKCVVEAAVLSCKRGALHVDGCQDETADMCTAGPAPL